MPRKTIIKVDIDREAAKLKAEVLHMLRSTDSTALARLISHARHSLQEQIESMETKIVCAAHFSRHAEDARLKPWLTEYQSQLQLLDKLQILIIHHDGKKAVEAYLRQRGGN